MHLADVYHFLNANPRLWDPREYSALDWSIVPERHHQRVGLRLKVWYSFLATRRAGKSASELGVSRSFVSNVLTKIYAPDSGGAFVGLRALVPYVDQPSRIRHAPLPTPDPAGFGFTGAFSLVLARQLPKGSIQEHLERYIRRHRAGAAGDPSDPEITKVHKYFKALCRRSGLGESDYPFSTSTVAYRSLATYVREFIRKFHAGQNFRLPNWRDALGEQGLLLPFEQSELDEHICDQWPFAKASQIEISWSDGPHVRYFELSRLSVVVELDVASDVALGFQLCERARNNSDDVVACIVKSTLPWTPATPTLAGLELPEKPVFASDIGAALGFRGRTSVKMDNDLTHYAKRTQTTLLKHHAAEVNYGRKKSPKSRGHIESFFDRLEDLLRSLPGFTGKFPGDKRGRRRQAVKPEVCLLIESIVVCIEAVLAEHNTTPNSGLGGMTPIEFLAHNHARNNILAYFCIPESSIDECFIDAIEATVRVRGGCPCVNAFHGTYFGDALVEWIGQSLVVKIDRRDGRYAELFTQGGKRVGRCEYRGPLQYRRHDVRERAFFSRWSRSPRLKQDPDAPGFSQYVTEQVEAAKQSVREATRLQQMKKNIDLSKNEPPVRQRLANLPTTQSGPTPSLQVKET